jgi:hypothetical protein
LPTANQTSSNNQQPSAHPIKMGKERKQPLEIVYINAQTNQITL